MRYAHRGYGDQPPMGPGTKTLCIIILVASVVFAERWGLPLGWSDFNFTVKGVLSLELWRLGTYPFVVGDPLALIIGLVVLFFFGRFFERMWGSRDFVQFFVAASIGAAVIAVPLSLLIGLLPFFADTGMASGPNAAFDAMLVALALTAPDSNVLFGFVLPMRAKTIIYLLLGIQVIVGLMTGVASLSITLGGMAMGYVLVTGMWRPDRIRAKLRVWRLKKRRKGLYVVPPDDKTLH